jgi:hypothetical protein
MIRSITLLSPPSSLVKSYVAPEPVPRQINKANVSSGRAVADLLRCGFFFLLSMCSDSSLVRDKACIEGAYYRLIILTFPPTHRTKMRYLNTRFKLAIQFAWSKAPPHPQAAPQHRNNSLQCNQNPSDPLTQLNTLRIRCHGRPEPIFRYGAKSERSQHGVVRPFFYIADVHQVVA